MSSIYTISDIYGIKNGFGQIIRKKERITTDKNINKRIKRKMHFPPRAERLTDFETSEEIPTDVLGSYTGSPEDGEKPVQDADDL